MKPESVRDYKERTGVQSYSMGSHSEKCLLFTSGLMKHLCGLALVQWDVPKALVITVWVLPLVTDPERGSGAS